MKHQFLVALLATTMVLPACARGDDQQQNCGGQRQKSSPAMGEMAQLQASAARESGRGEYEFQRIIRTKVS